MSPNKVYSYKAILRKTDSLIRSLIRLLMTFCDLIAPWNYAKSLNKNLSLKNSTSKKIKYFLNKLFIEKYILISIFLVIA